MILYLQHKKEKIMGTIKQGILGGFSGKVGTVVGSTWKSVHYMRALAVSFSDPRTEKQKNQRSKFTAAVNFTKAMTPFWIQRIFRTAISIQCCRIVYSETCNER